MVRDTQIPPPQHAVNTTQPTHLIKPTPPQHPKQPAKPQTTQSTLSTHAPKFCSPVDRPPLDCSDCLLFGPDCLKLAQTVCFKPRLSGYEPDCLVEDADSLSDRSVLALLAIRRDVRHDISPKSSDGDFRRQETQKLATGWGDACLRRGRDPRIMETERGRAPAPRGSFSGGPPSPLVLPIP